MTGPTLARGGWSRRNLAAFAVMFALLTAVPLATGRMSSAHAAGRAAVSADAADRAFLNKALQRSWSKQNASARYKVCYMWVMYPEVFERDLLRSFRSYYFSDRDVLSVANSFFYDRC